jgi:hypothetical protein
MPPGKASDGLAGRRVTYPFAGGWAVGFDAGEFGGGLWWLTADGSERHKLADRNVMGLLSADRGLLVLVGLSHLGFSQGGVLLVTQEGSATPAARVLVELPGAPEAFDSPDPGTVVVGTTRGIVSVATDGTVRLLSTSRELPRANSLLVDPTGAIYVGMKHFVLLLAPRAAGYEEIWLGPKKCPSLRELGAGEGHKCECTR